MCLNLANFMGGANQVWMIDRQTERLDKYRYSIDMYYSFAFCFFIQHWMKSFSQFPLKSLSRRLYSRILIKQMECGYTGLQRVFNHPREGLWLAWVGAVERKGGREAARVLVREMLSRVGKSRLWASVSSSVKGGNTGLLWGTNELMYVNYLE